MFIRYERLAYFDREDNDFRISFDTNIMTRREDVELHKGDFGTLLLDEGHYLMEVKCKGGLPLWFTQLMSELKIYKTSYSKYGNEYKKYVQEAKPQNALMFSLAS